MNSNLVKCLPVFVLSLGLAACGKSQSPQKGEDGTPRASVAQVEAAFEADCGANTPTASASTVFDTASCQLNQSQTALLREIGPLKVEADCTHQSIRIKNTADQITGEGSLNADGTYSIPLKAGARFAELGGCPVNLQGVATGTVTCNGDKKVVSVKVNTAFNFAHAPAAAAAVALADNGVAPVVAAAPASAVAPAPVSASTSASTTASANTAAMMPDGEFRPDGDHRRDDRHDGRRDGRFDDDRFGRGHGGYRPYGHERQEQGKLVLGKGGVPNVVVGKGGPVVTTPIQGGVPVVVGKGNQAVLGKGGKIGMESGQIGRAPGYRVDACVNFSPCAFKTEAALSCSR